MEALLERLQRLQSYDARGFSDAEVVVTGTGFVGPSRRALKDLCAAAGITYSGDLIAGWTTHLVANPACISDAAAAPKMHAAARWNVPAVRLPWLLESIRQGEPLPVEPYLLVPTAASAAPLPRSPARPPRPPREELTVRSVQGSFHPHAALEPTPQPRSYPCSSVVGVMTLASQAPRAAAAPAASPTAERSPLSEVCNVEAQMRRLSVTSKPQREAAQTPAGEATPRPLDSPAASMQHLSGASPAVSMQASESGSPAVAPMQQSSDEASPPASEAAAPAAVPAQPASARKPMSPEWWNQGDGMWVPGSQPRTDPMALGTPSWPQPRATSAALPSPAPPAPTPVEEAEFNEISLAPPLVSDSDSDSEGGGSGSDDDGATPTPLKGPLSRFEPSSFSFGVEATPADRLDPSSFSFGVEATPAEPTPPADLTLIDPTPPPEALISKVLATPDIDATPLNVPRPAATTHIAETQSEADDSPEWCFGGESDGGDGFGEPSCLPEVPVEMLCGGQPAPNWDDVDDDAAVGTPAAEDAVTPTKSCPVDPVYSNGAEDPILSSCGGGEVGEEPTPSPPSSSDCSNRSPSPQVVARARAPLPALPPLPSGLGDEPPDDTVALKLLQRAPRGSTVKARYRLANTRMVSFAEEVHIRGLKLTFSVKDKDKAVVLKRIEEGNSDDGGEEKGLLLADPVSFYRVMGECWQMEYHRLYTGPQALALAAAAGVRLRLPPGFDASRELLRGVAREHADMRRVEGTAAVRRVRLGVTALRTRGAAGEAPPYYWRCQIDAEAEGGPQTVLP